MSRRDVRMERVEYPVPPPSQCAKVLYYTWKLCSVVFSHFVMISLVVAYCILGAVTFEKLEAENEREVKRNISQIRNNTTHTIWSMTKNVPLLDSTNWTSDVVEMLKDFENAILLEMKVRGWDGNESTERIQWTFTGALFYSIIVITTIGYGHIAPKTQTGKVVTIFYAILGIPLMLLCLSNIGDVMASSFRFIYWRVCCYVCTRPPKHNHQHRRPRHATLRRSVRGASGAGSGSTRRRRPLTRAHSDTDCRYRDSGYSSARARKQRPQQSPPAVLGPSPSAARTSSQPPARSRPYDSRDIERVVERSPVRYEKYSHDVYDDDNEEFPKISLPLQNLAAALNDLEDHNKKVTSKAESRSKSLPRAPASRHEYEWTDQKHYELDDERETLQMHDLYDVDYENYKERKALERDRRRRQMDDLPIRDRGYDPEDDDYEFDSLSNRRGQRMNRGCSEYYERDREDYGSGRNRGRRAKSAVYDYERRWDIDRDNHRRDVESGSRGVKRLRRLQTVDETFRSHRRSPSPEKEEWSDEFVQRRGRPSAWSSSQPETYPAPSDIEKAEIKPVPIWLCVLLVASYIVAGTFLFKQWEAWAYLDAAYFCFITLTTIGFGDFVPAQGQSGDATAAVHSIALCSLYLLFGIALLAMSFNLVQEEVRANVASVATKLGIIKPRDKHHDDEDY